MSKQVTLRDTVITELNELKGEHSYSDVVHYLYECSPQGKVARISAIFSKLSHKTTAIAGTDLTSMFEIMRMIAIKYYKNPPANREILKEIEKTLDELMQEMK